MRLTRPRPLALLLAACLPFIIDGCAQLPSGQAPAAPTAPANGARYEPAPGRDAATIARLRLAPPPVVPELVEGGTPLTDRNRLAGAGYTRIGSGWIDVATPELARRTAIVLGQQAHAERVLLYPPQATGGPWQVVCYVRLQLLLGASFRDLTAEERARLGADGVSIGQVLPGTPAARANLMHADIVLAVDGQPVDGRRGFEALLRRHAGEAVMLTLVRRDETLQRQVQLGALPPEP